MGSSLFAVCVILLVFAVSIIGMAQAPPSADAYVTDTQPGVNFGRSAILAVQSGTTSYIRLNLGALPANAVIGKATLRLYVNAVAAPGAFDVYRVNTAWSEQTVNLNNAPQLGPSATGGNAIEVTAASRNQFLLIDITALARSWANGSVPNNGVALVLKSPSGSFSFDAKESGGSGHEPELYIILDSAPGVSIGAVSSSSIVNGMSALLPAGPYINNGTVLQTGANFNIDGTGSAATFNATSQFLLGGVPVLGSSGTSGLFLGTGAGLNNSGTLNTFLGVSTGQLNATGSYNTFTGSLAGQNNLAGSNLTFLGTQAGYSNTSGANNTFLGMNAGYLNNSGNYNTYVGSYAGENNLDANYNTFVGSFAGATNRHGTINTFVGAQAGFFNADGIFNSMIGVNAGYYNTSGNFNTFLGVNAGVNAVSGNQNTYIGYASGQNADPASHDNVYLASVGAAGESGAIRVGDASRQTVAYIAGVSGQSTNSGVPVFIDSTGKLGSGGGSVNFTQVTGTVASSQLTGTYTNQVVLSNTTNVVDGSFAGNFTGIGAGLTGVTSGLNWPIVTKSADYAIQASDFATPTTSGNYLILTGKVSHTFTLPNPPPPNGSCVAIGNVADPGTNNSGTNVFLTVSPNGLNVDNSIAVPTMPRSTAYLYCSDGSAGYYRLGYPKNGVSEIGPWIKTYDTGTLNAMTTTFRNGMDGGLADGSVIFLLPKFANTSNAVSLNVNGLGAHYILRYGNHGLAPGDLSPNAYALLIYNVNGAKWELLNPQSTQTFSGTTASIGGSLVTAGTCTTGTVTVTGATVGHPVAVSASDGSLQNPLVILSAAVTASNTVTVQLCAVADVTPAAKTYNVATQ